MDELCYVLLGECAWVNVNVYTECLDISARSQIDFYQG